MELSRFRLPLVLAIVLAVISCRPIAVEPSGEQKPVTTVTSTTLTARRGCDAGIERRESPVVCVDDLNQALSVVPDPVHVFDVHPGDRAPVVILWVTRSGEGDLRIQPMTEGCVETVVCSGRGDCRTRTRPLQGAPEKVCKYDVWIEGGKQPRLDPTVVVTPCCVP